MEFGQTGKALVDAAKIHPKFKEFVVLTTFEEIEQELKGASSMSAEKRLNMKLQIYLTVVRYSADELAKMCKEQTQEWYNWCIDVILFYVYRLAVAKDTNVEVEDKFLIPAMPYNELPESFTHIHEFVRQNA